MYYLARALALVIFSAALPRIIKTLWLVEGIDLQYQGGYSVSLIPVNISDFCTVFFSSAFTQHQKEDS